MSAAHGQRPAGSPLHLDPPSAPAWVAEALGEDAKQGTHQQNEDARVRVVESPEFCWIALTVPDAEDLDVDRFGDAVRGTYGLLGDIIAKRGVHLLRIWNYIPGILSPVAGGSNRYEVFNAGRFEGYRGRLVQRNPGLHFCAASAVGHRGRDLVLHALAGRTPGIAVENPRQRPAYRYSRRCGAVPPGFARAVRIEGSLGPADTARSAIVSGTASIVGEDTRHPGDSTRQLAESLQNLVHLSRALAGDPVHATPLSLDEPGARQALARYTDLRVYVAHDDDSGGVITTLERTLPGLRRLELAAADLCRSGLRVEIEGIARLDP